MNTLYMTQLFKTSNFGTISPYFTCCSCNNIIAMPVHCISCATRTRNVTFVQRLTVHISSVTLVYNGTIRPIRFCMGQLMLFKFYITLFILFISNALFFVIYYTNLHYSHL